MDVLRDCYGKSILSEDVTLGDFFFCSAVYKYSYLLRTRRLNTDLTVQGS